MGAEPGLASLILAHGGIPGLIAETGSVFVGLAVFGYFIRRSARKEREQERGPTKPEKPEPD